MSHCAQDELAGLAQEIGVAQFATGVHCEQWLGRGNSVRNVPDAHDVQSEFAGLVQVTWLEQNEIALHGTHTEAPLELSRKYPAWHCVHCESPGVLHSRIDAQ